MASVLLKQKFKEYENSPEAIAWGKVWKKYFNRNMLVPSPVFDFLRSIHANEEYEGQGKKFYTVYTVKAKGSKHYNLSFKVDRKVFNAIKTILQNMKSSVAVDSPEILFSPETGELRIWGLPVYLKKDTDRFVLCKYMFGKKKHPNRWEVGELIEALGGTYDPQKREEFYKTIYKKIDKLNENVFKGIGFEDFIVSEAGAFVVNGLNIPKIK